MQRSMLIVTGILVVATILYVNANSITGDGYSVGDYASDFKLTGTSGETVSMADYEDAKGFILVFTCNTCPYAKLYEGRIMDLDAKYSAKGYPVIAINPNDIAQKPGDSMEEMKIRAEEKNYSFPYLRDDSQEVAKMYGATKTPHLYILNKDEVGRLKVEFIGAIDDSPRDASKVEKTYVEDAVEALLSGKSPSVKKADAIGCTIRWKAS